MPAGLASPALRQSVIGAILLAAGSSRRFSSDKLLAPLQDGTPMAARVATTLVAASIDVVAVVRPHASQLTEALTACGARTICCPDADEGMGTSLAWGVAAAAHWNGWLIALADMPFVAESTVRAIVAAVANGAVLAAPRYRGQRGHPVGFGAEFRASLLALRGDRGGRDLVMAAGDRLHLVDCDDAGVLTDIDRPEDLERYNVQFGTRERE